MKEKSLVSSFAISNTIDIVVTLFVLSHGLGTEFNPLARQMIARGDVANLLILKVAYAAVLIGVYALATSLNSRLRYPTEKSLQIATA
jgi:hypothetical protein